MGTDDIFKPTVGNEASKHNGFRIASFATSKDLHVKEQDVQTPKHS
jgi:hypothetical protein